MNWQHVWNRGLSPFHTGKVCSAVMAIALKIKLLHHECRLVLRTSGPFTRLFVLVNVIFGAHIPQPSCRHLLLVSSFLQPKQSRPESSSGASCMAGRSWQEALWEREKGSLNWGGLTPKEMLRRHQLNAISSQFNLFSLFSSRVFGWRRWVWSSVCLWIFCFVLVLFCVAFFKKLHLVLYLGFC